jgi:ubiquinone/menaquinone biosynthesis C-methylase UbiE
VVGLDASATMVGAARAAAGPPAVVADAAALPLRDGAADCAVAFMPLPDVDDLDAAVGELARVLAPGGRLVVAIVHPVNSAGYFEEDDPPAGALPPFVIREPYLANRRYSDPVERNGLTMRFDSMHRPLQDYAEALVVAGFVIERLREPAEPDPSSKWAALPLFLHLRAVLADQPR